MINPTTQKPRTYKNGLLLKSNIHPSDSGRRAEKNRLPFDKTSLPCGAIPRQSIFPTKRKKRFSLQKNARRRAEKPQNSEEWIKTIGVKKPPIPALAQRAQADKYSLAPDCEKSSCRNDLSEDRFCSCLSDLCIFKWLIHPRVVLSAYNKWRKHPMIFAFTVSLRLLSRSWKPTL